MAIKEYKLGQICDVKTGNMNKEDSDENGKFPFFTRSTNILKCNKFTIDGNYTIIPGEGIFQPMYTSGKAAVHQRVYFIKANNNFILDKYLYYWWIINSKILYKYAVGTTVKSLRLNNFLNPIIKLIDINEQQQIIDIIEPFEKILYNYKLKLNKINNILISLYKTLSIDNLISINKIIKVNFNKYDEQKYYYDTSTISTSKIGIPELISFNKKSRANLTPEKNSIIISKLIGENKIFPIFTSFYDNSVFSTGFLNFSSKYSAYVYGYMLTNEFINIKKSTMSGSVMASINNKSINNWQINDINIKKWDNKFDNLLILINYYNSLILKINNVIKKLIDLYII